MPAILEALAADLEQRKQDHLYRYRHVIEGPQTPRLIIDGREFLAFCSNDYLGLANHPALKSAAAQAIEQYGLGSGASHLVSGHSSWHHELEERFARRLGRDRAVLFSSGFMANLGVITAILGKQDAVFEDRLNHASLLDGGLLSGARFQRFHHNDMEHLNQKLLRSSARRKLVCVDGVFSMDGDLADVDGLVSACQQHDAILMIDDAHGFGVLGQQGLGISEIFHLNQEKLPILMCTLGKALGGFGAIVAGPEALIETLIQYARPYIYTTALPPAVAAAVCKSLELLDEEPWRRKHLQELVDYFREQATLMGLPLMASDSPIQPLLLGEESLTLQWQEALRAKGIWITAIRPPTVPKGTARLRMTFTAAHTKEDICMLLEALADIGKHLPIETGKASL